jgi:hypothetical protein
MQKKNRDMKIKHVRKKNRKQTKKNKGKDQYISQKKKYR